MTDLTSVGADAANQTPDYDADDEGESEFEFEPYDVRGLPWIKQHPTTAVRGEAVALRRFQDWTEDDDGWSMEDEWYGLVLRDPSVVSDDNGLSGSTAFANSEESGDDYKVVDTNDEDTTVEEGLGVTFGNNLFRGDEIDAIDEDEVVLKLSGSSGKSAVTTLESYGRVGARRVGALPDEEIELHDGGFPEHNGGFLEYQDDGPSRTSRHPVLRSDVEGRGVVVMIQRLADVREEYDGDSYWATVLADVEDERAQELAEEYADRDENRFEGEFESDDYFVEIDGDEFLKLKPDAVDRVTDEDLIVDTGAILFDENQVDEDALNEARVEAGFDPLDDE